MKYKRKPARRYCKPQKVLQHIKDLIRGQFFLSTNDYQQRASLRCRENNNHLIWICSVNTLDSMTKEALVQPIHHLFVIASALDRT